jgi:hypothetical protein
LCQASFCRSTCSRGTVSRYEPGRKADTLSKDLPRWLPSFWLQYRGGGDDEATPFATANPATDLSTPERVLLFCVASDTEWEPAGIKGETVTAMIICGLHERDAAVYYWICHH